MGAEALLAGDSVLYLGLGRDFVSEGDFVRFIDDARGFEPETERMPLYVIWLALHQWLSGISAPLFPALTQAFTVVGKPRAAFFDNLPFNR